MIEELKTQLQQVVDLSESCPELYRLTCFEILWTTVVRHSYNQMDDSYHTNGVSTEAVPVSIGAHNDGVDQNAWKKVFHLQGDSWVIIAKSLKETTKAKRQVKLALLLGIADMKTSGRSFINRTALVDYCKKYAAYDSPNFAATMRRQKELLIETDGGWELTMPGQERALEVVEELTQ